MGVRPISAEQAAGELRRGGYEPLEPYPGKASAMWKVRCVECGQPRSLRLTMVRSGRPCSHLAPKGLPEADVRRELEAAGFDLESGYTGRASVVLTLRCRECGDPKRLTLADVRAGRRCGHRPPSAPVTSPQEAVEEMRGYGFEPLEPYPGTVNDPWRQRCTAARCGRERSVTLKAARAGRRCLHRPVDSSPRVKKDKGE